MDSRKIILSIKGDREMKNGWFKIAVIAGLVLFLGMGTAMAGTWAGGAEKAVLTGAHTNNFTAVGAVANSTFTLGNSEALAINDTVTITLTGGPTFVNAPLTLACPAVDLGSGVGVASAPLSGGTTGSTTATWRLLTTAATGSVITFNSAAFIFNVTPLSATGRSDLLMDLKTSTGTSIGTVNKSFRADVNHYLFVGAYGLTVTPITQFNTADVRAATGPYTKFENNLMLGTATTLTIFNNSNAANSVPSNQFDVKKILVTLTGDFVGVSKITGADITGSSSAGSTTGGVVGEYMINSDKTAAYGVNSGVLGAQVGMNADPIFTIDGTTTQPARMFTATVQSLEQGVVWLPYTYFGPRNHYEIRRNGVSFTANSLGQYNTVKVSDKSGSQPAAGGKVNVVAWDTAGVKLANAAGVTDILLKSNETITLTGDQLAARFVGTAMKYEVSIESTGALISNVKKTPEGFGSNVYTNANGAL
jgi:hypothetical protein